MANPDQERKPKYGRAFNAAVSSDWPITEDGFKTMLTIAARLNPDSAVEAYESDELAYTRSATIRDGIAIIPVEGPIFRYASFFTRFSGGTTVDDLAKDFNSALDNPKVHAIMFEINSPGGEVTGINEFADMVYNARSRKPMTARVGGMGCSAAYWIASACGDIVVDDTALLGSIGVMSVYLDDRKNMEMNGLEEIEFISSQSPYKNAPAYSEEGKKRIQKRVDALAQVFVEKVARNRGVTVEMVLKGFGQGDVFVGQAAVDAGLADRFGSFEDSLRLLAETHNPFFNKDKSMEQENLSTLNNSADVDSSGIEHGEETSPHQISNDEVQMSEKTNKQSAAEGETEEEVTETEETVDETETESTDEPDTEDGASEKETKPAATAPVIDLEAREKALNARETALEAREKAAKKQELDAKALVRKTEFEAIAADFAGDKAAKVTLMESLADKFGEDSSEFTSYVEDQKALGAQIDAGSLFEEKGKPGANSDIDAAVKLDTMAKERAKTDKISYEKAYGLVSAENRELASQAIADSE